MLKPCFFVRPGRWLLAGTLFLLTSLATASDTLTVYTYSSFTSEWGPGSQIKKAFEDQCGCELNYVSLDDGVSLLNRLRLEGASTRADVVLGLDDALIEETRSLGLVQDHGLEMQALNLKDELAWQDADFLPFDFGYFAFIYDTENTRPVGSLAELLESEASVIYQDPRTSTPGQGLLIWMKAVYGDEAPAAWEKLREQTVTVTKGWSEAYSLFLEGEADYVLSYTTSPAYHQIAEETDRYQAAEFSEGHPRQIEVAAISRYSEQPELAQEFLQFLVSEKAQQILPVTNWMLPVVEGIELPEAFDRLIQPQAIGFTPEQIHQQRQTWVREWRSAVSR
ncbi:thiamine ABC transporter substrate binding subunit [Marinospirillum sp.]|uniref:thiamine ABC transporter substrate binding subunit n=1 Tax=Marinospirillum sp. TaxID=2183934 RepID=UPI00384F0B3C